MVQYITKKLVASSNSHRSKSWKARYEWRFTSLGVKKGVASSLLMYERGDSQVSILYSKVRRAKETEERRSSY